MNFKEITSETGAIIKIGAAPFEDCIQLKNAITKELAKTGLNLDKGLDIKNMDLDEILKPIMQIDSSKEFYEAFFKCAIKSLYNNEKITKQIFDEEKAREDYYLIIFEVTKRALAPFFKSLVLAFPQVTKGMEKKTDHK